MRKILGLLFLLTGCFRPHYDPQPVDLPTEWRLQADEGSTLCNFRWWEQFQDPVLNQLVLTALKNNQDLHVAIARVYDYYGRLGIVNSNLYPALYGNGSYNRAETSLNIPVGLTPGVGRINNDFQAFFNLSWQLDFWGRYRSASDAAYAQLLTQIEARRAVVMTVVSAVADAYIVLRQLDMQLDISKQTVASRQYFLKLAQDRFELGETSEMEVMQAAAEVESTKIRLIEFELAMSLQENLLSVIVGENPYAIERGVTIDLFKYPVTIPTGLPSDLLVRRPDIMGAEDNLIAANALVTEARTLYFPQFQLTGAYGNESDMLKNFLTAPSRMWQEGFSAVQTLFDAGKISYQVDSAIAQRDEALFIYRQTILTALKEVDDGLISYQKNKELAEEHRIQVAVLAKYLELAVLRYNEGETDYLNVLDAERTLFAAQLAFVQAQSDSFTAVVELYNALGGGWVIDADAMATTLNAAEVEIGNGLLEHIL